METKYRKSPRKYFLKYKKGWIMVNFYDIMLMVMKMKEKKEIISTILVIGILIAMFIIGPTGILDDFMASLSTVVSMYMIIAVSVGIVLFVGLIIYGLLFVKGHTYYRW